MHAAGEMGKEYATKSTIAKLNAIIMERYESYMTRRVPIQIPAGTNPLLAAQMRLQGIRDLMWMEMPDHFCDFDGTTTYTPVVPFSALRQLFNAKYVAKKPSANFEPAECLYLIVNLGSPESMEQFNSSEIGDIDGDGWPEFLDGWGKPIFFLRWAPAFNLSDIQTNISDWTNNTERTTATQVDHDPFDPRRTDLQKQDETDASINVATGWRTVPLIYSWGNHGDESTTGIFIGGTSYSYNGNPYMTINDNGTKRGLGSPTNDTAIGNITNHHIEQR
jgi:hypothetical protein